MKGNDRYGHCRGSARRFFGAAYINIERVFVQIIHCLRIVSINSSSSGQPTNKTKKKPTKSSQFARGICSFEQSELCAPPKREHLNGIQRIFTRSPQFFRRQNSVHGACVFVGENVNRGPKNLLPAAEKY